MVHNMEVACFLSSSVRAISSAAVCTAPPGNGIDVSMSGWCPEYFPGFLPLTFSDHQLNTFRILQGGNHPSAVVLQDERVDACRFQVPFGNLGIKFILVFANDYTLFLHDSPHCSFECPRPARI